MISVLDKALGQEHFPEAPCLRIHLSGKDKKRRDPQPAGRKAGIGKIIFPRNAGTYIHAGLLPGRRKKKAVPGQPLEGTLVDLGSASFHNLLVLEFSVFLAELCRRRTETAAGVVAHAFRRPGDNVRFHKGKDLRLDVRDHQEFFVFPVFTHCGGHSADAAEQTELGFGPLVQGLPHGAFFLEMFLDLLCKGIFLIGP